MEFKDYYKILGVERSADPKALSQAFRRLARQHHPDVNRGDKGAEAKFKEINEAYQVLNDPERRARYDQILELRQRGGGWEDLLRRGAGAGRGPGGAYTVYTSPEDLAQFSDFFQQLFGGLGGDPFGAATGGARSGRARRGGFRIEDLLKQQPDDATEQQGLHQDAEGTVEITLEEAFHGAARTVTVPGGAGRAAHSIEVKIPKGVRAGQRIRAAGQARGGDLYLIVQIAPHPVFTRVEDDILCDLQVPVWTAALGGEVKAPTLAGPVSLTIPAGTPDGRTLRLRGQGIPHLRGGGAGDELVKIRLALPHPLTPRDRELFEEMRRLHEGPAANP